MNVYTVETDSLGGRFGKFYKRGHVVKSSDFQPGIADSLEKRGMIRKIATVAAPVVAKKRTEIESQHVSSHNVEFGYELLSALPYAYHLHKQGKLKSTESAVDTAPFYYFSPNHTQNAHPRGWGNMERARAVPNIRIHQPDLDWSVFEPPPLREQYKNERFKWDKPTLCICNRVNVEWQRGVINYFDEETLDKLFADLSGDYHIVYFNIEGRPEFYDGVKPVPINDIELCRKYGIDIIHDLVRENRDLSFNTVQLMVMANCQAFITMNGGYGILASYMGGTNIIYSKECQELSPKVNSFTRWYHRLGGSRIIHAGSYRDLHREVQVHFIDKLPTVNILIRTYRRPKYFEMCMESIREQTYPNIRVFVGYHDYQTAQYVIPYTVTPVPYEVYGKQIERKDDRDTYGAPFPMNHYLNELSAAVQDGHVILLDDDDRFTSKNAVAEIMRRVMESGPDTMVCWRLFAMNRTIPSDENWTMEPKPRDISGITMCMPASVFKQHRFEPYRLGDYRLAKYMWPRVKKVFIDAKLTEMISGTCNMGRGNDL